MRPYPKPQQKEKLKTCKNCKSKFKPKGFNQKYCMVKNECVGAFLSDKKKHDDKLYRIDRKKRKERLKSVSDWKNDLQKVVNQIVRELDKDKPCISHPDQKDFLRYDAGHAFTVKAHSDIRFNVHNIHKQSSSANERHGFCAEYADGLINRYGQEYLDMVLGLPLKYEGTAKEKFKIDLIRDEYLPNARKVLRELKAGAEFTRDQINEMVGIYD